MPYFSLDMLKIEKSYIEYCTEHKLDPLKVKTCEDFLCELRNDKPRFLKEVDELKLKIDPRSPLGKICSVALVNSFEDVNAIFEIVALSENNELTISERRNELKKLSDDFFEEHFYDNKKRNDFIATTMFITECLRAELYDLAYKASDSVFLKKYQNTCLGNFFKLYIDIFADKEIDPQFDFDEEKFGTLPILSDVLYFLYCLREENDDEADKTLEKIKCENKEMYFLFGLGFCTVKIDVASLPKYSLCKTFGQLDPNLDYFKYKESLNNLILFLKIGCEYCFKFFYQFERKFNEEATDFLGEQLAILSTQEKMLAVAIMTVGFQQFNTTNLLKLKISNVKKIIRESTKISNGSEDIDPTMMFFDKFLSQDDESLDEAFIALQGHNFIANLDFDNDTFEPQDELFVFTNAFTSGLLKAFKDNPSLIDSDELNEFSVVDNFDDDKPGNKS